MLRNIKDYLGYRLLAKDGDVGTVQEFLFDAADWVVRYLAVDLSGEDGGQILLAPGVLGPPEYKDRVFQTVLLTDQVRNSPRVDLNLPITRQLEMGLHDYFGWPYYWDSTSVSGVGPGNLMAALPLIELEEQIAEERAENNPSIQETASRLHTTREVLGFEIQARDGAVGSLEDFIIQDEVWNIVYLVVKTGGLLDDKKVLLAASWIEKIDWERSKIQVDLKQETVRNSPEYDPSRLLDREAEGRLYEHYGRDKYW